MKYRKEYITIVSDGKNSWIDDCFDTYKEAMENWKILINGYIADSYLYEDLPTTFNFTMIDTNRKIIRQRMLSFK